MEKGEIFELNRTLIAGRLLELIMPQTNRTIPLEHLPGEIENWLVGHTIDEVERSLIVHTLAHCNWNRTRAAKGLGISLRTMRNKLREYQS